MERLIALLDVGRLVTRLVEFVPSAVVALLIMLFFWIVFRATAGPLGGVLRRAGLHETVVHMMIDNVYRLALVLFGLIMALDQVGINVRAALTGLGVAGIAIGFAAQDSLANIIAGFIIFFDKPFTGGDWVSVAGQYGQVSRITMRSTRIQTLNNTYVVIPNKTIIDEVLVNHSHHGAVRVVVPVGIAYKEHIPKAREVLLAAVENLPGVLKTPGPSVVTTSLGASSVDLQVRVWTEDVAAEQPMFARVLEAAKLALDDAGIEIPYHHLQLFIENVDDRVWNKARRLAG